MPSLDQVLQVYQELAEWHEGHGPPQVRDRFLILAADAARSAGREDEADRLRRHLLHLNPHHLLRPYASFAEALRSPDVQNYVNDLKQNYPPEFARQMLEEIRTGGERAEAPPTLPLPPTLPVVDIDPPQPKSSDPVVVYWDDTERTPDPAPGPKPAQRPPAKQPARTPVPPLPSARSAPAPGKLARMAAARRETYPLRPEPPPPAAGGRPGEPDEDEKPRAAWVASGLFGTMLAVSLGLAVYTVVRPFLPPEWLPW